MKYNRLNPSTNLITAIVVVLVLSALAWFFIPKSKVLVEVNQPGFTLTIDGKTYNNISSGGTIQLRSGDHIYSITKYGFAPKGGVFESKDFSTSSIKADLVAISIIELEYKDFNNSFGEDAESTNELRPKDGWIVATIVLDPFVGTKKLVVFKKTNGQINITINKAIVFCVNFLCEFQKPHRLRGRLAARPFAYPTADTGPVVRSQRKLS